MTTPKSLPARPSQESLRKQAKKLARDVAAGNAAAIARARTQLPAVEPPLSQRDAQLVLAREYGYAPRCCPGEVRRMTAACWAWPQFLSVTVGIRKENDSSPERLAPSS